MNVLIPERDAAISLALSDSNELISAQLVQISGFQLYINTDWLSVREKLVKTVVVYTGNAQDVLCCCSLNFSAFEKQAQQEFAAYLFINEYMSGGFQAKQVPEYGTIYIGSPQQFSTQTSTFYQVPQGDFVGYTDLIYLNLNLMKLGFGERSGSVLKEPTELQMEQFSNYFNTKAPTGQFARFVVKFSMILQQALVFLDFLPLNFAVDGILCSQTENAILNYKKPLEDDLRFCSKEVAQALVTQVQQLHVKLDELGYGSPDPFLFPERFTKKIKHFQKSAHLLVTKTLNLPTINAINSFEGRARIQVSNTVNQFRNKVEEFAGLRYDTLDERANHSTESLNINGQQADLNLILKSMLKKDADVLQKEAKKTRHRKRMSLVTDTFDSKATYKIFLGIKESTAKTLGEIAKKTKSMNRQINQGMKQLIQPHSSSSESETDEEQPKELSPMIDMEPIESLMPVEQEFVQAFQPIHSSVIEAATRLLAKMNIIDTQIQELESISINFNTAIEKCNQEALIQKKSSEELQKKLDLIEHEQKQLDKVLELVTNDHSKAKYSVGILQEKVADFDEMLSSNWSRLKKLESLVK